MVKDKIKKQLILLASDHNGVELKEYLNGYLDELGYTCIDLGPYDTEKSVDYVDYASQLGHIINSGQEAKGILICGTGVGMSIVANRYDNVRAALIHNLESASKCREHNNSNVLCLGSWLTPPKRAQEITDSWLGTKFGEGRHVKRLEKISSYNPGTIVLTNGIFDILHTGHIELFKFAKNLGDKLVVAVNSDKATKQLKGNNRPINSEEDRKKVLQSLKEIDEVIIFDDVETKNLMSVINPDIMVKGGEWSAEEVRIRDMIPNHIDIKIYPLLKDYSTTNVLKKIKQLDTWQKNE
tara:strand:+ start:6104 stop:6991 length:888 start_codon:yes stop_codon:yes gene_type:complete